MPQSACSRAATTEATSFKAIEIISSVAESSQHKTTFLSIRVSGAASVDEARETPDGPRGVETQQKRS